MGRPRKSEIPQKYQAEENILPQSTENAEPEIDYGYPLEIIETAAKEGQKQIEEHFGRKLTLDEREFWGVEGLEAVEFYILHPGATTRQYHSRFLAKKLRSGWRFGAFNIEELYHPHILPFEELTDSQRETLAVFKWAAMAVLEQYSNKTAFDE